MNLLNASSHTTEILLACLILFVVGGLQDLGSAWYLTAASAKNYRLAAVISAVHTFASYAIYAIIAEKLLSGEIIPLLAYSLGGGLGTFVGLKKGIKT